MLSSTEVTKSNRPVLGCSARDRRWIVTRQRPSEGAPSMSLSFLAGTPTVALIRMLDRYGNQPIGTRVEIRHEGADRYEVSAVFERTEERWIDRTPTYYVGRKSSELRPGMIVNTHGLRCLIDQPISSREINPPQYGCDAVYWTHALVLNRDEVSSDAVPYSFTAPREVWSDAARRWVKPTGEHRWSLQGNDNAWWSVEAPPAW